MKHIECKTVEDLILVLSTLPGKLPVFVAGVKPLSVMVLPEQPASAMFNASPERVLLISTETACWI